MDGLEQRIDRAVRGQGQPTVTILSSLLAVEDELHYVPREAVERVAEFIGATVNDVWAVASFYPNFRFRPPAARQVEVCWGASCHLLGAMGVMRSALAAAGLEDEGERADHRLSVRLNTCLGACSQAPVMAFDHHLAGRVTPEAAARRVSELLRAELALPGVLADATPAASPPPGVSHDAASAASPPPGVLDDAASAASPPPGVSHDNAPAASAPPGVLADDAPAASAPPGVLADDAAPAGSAAGGG